MKQYKIFIPYYLRLLLLLVLGQLPLCVLGQDLSDTRWYFGNSPQWISFPGGAQLNTDQATPYGSAGSLVATDFQTGDLLFYSDGQQLFGPGNTPIATGLPGDPSLPQPVHATPIPGVQNEFFLFFITPARGMQYARYNTATQTLSSPQPLTLGGTASGVMEVVRGATPTGYVYWVIVPLQGNSATFSLIRISGTGTPAPITMTVSPTVADFNPSSLAYSPETGLLAVGNAATTQGVPILLYGFAADPAQPDPAQLTAAGSLTDVTSVNGAIRGLSWIDSYLYVAKAQNAAGAAGSLYRYNFANYDPQFLPSGQTISGTAFAEILDLRTGPNSEVYMLYRNALGGASLVGKVNNPKADFPSFDATAFGTTNFQGNRFSRSAFPAFQPTPPVGFDYSGGCTKSPTYFYPIFEERGPERVEWYIDGSLVSSELQPSLTLDQAGTFNVTMRAYYPGDVRETSQSLTVTDVPELQIEPQPTTFCPDEVHEITLKDSDGNPVQATWYRPLSAANPPSKNAVELNVDKISVSTHYDPATMRYPEAGTYFAVANINGCEVSVSFEVIVRDDEFSKSNLWYFGNGAGINFNEQPPTAVDESQMRGANQAPEGTTISVDANADPLFYTNGQTLWTRDADGDGVHDVAPNGMDLSGSLDATQNSLLMPHPNDPTLHYLFTISNDPAQKKALFYNVADLKGNGGSTGGPTVPDVELATSPGGTYVKSRLLFPNVAEKLAGSSSSGWVVAHELGTNRFISYPVTQEGIGSPVFSNAGSVISEEQSKGYMVLAPNDTLLALALPDAAGGNAIQIFDFDEGRVQDDRHITIPIEGDGTLYGLTFSPNSKRLFFTLTGSTSSLYQVSIDSAFREQETINTLVKVAEVNEPLGALQIGPDRALYVAREGAGFLGVVQTPDDSLTADIITQNPNLYNNEGIALSGGTNSRLGLPNLVESIGRFNQEPTVTASNVCAEEDGTAVVEFSGTRRFENEELVYTVYGGANFATPIGSPIRTMELEPVTFNITEPGDYKVVLTLDACNKIYPTDPDYVSQGKTPVEAFFTVFGKPVAAIKNTSPVQLCDVQSITLQGEVSVRGQVVADPTGYFFIWSNNITGELIGTSQNQPVSEAGTYRLDVISPAGCESEPKFIDVTDSRPEGEIPQEDVSVCTGDPDNEIPSRVTVDGVQAGYSISWFEDRATGSFAPAPRTTDLEAWEQPTNVDPARPGIYRYKVVVVGPDPTCKKEDILTITVSSAPRATLSIENNDCKGNAELVATVQGGTGPYRFEYSNGVINTSTSRTDRISVSISSEETFTVIVYDEALGANSCPSTSKAVVVKVDAIDVDIEIQPGCQISGRPALNEITATTGYTGNVRYEWFDVTRNRTIALNDVTIQVPDGIYRVTVTATDGTCAGVSASTEAEVKNIISPVIPDGVICPEMQGTISSSWSDTLSAEYKVIGWFKRENGTTREIGTSNTIVISEEGQYELRIESCTNPIVFNIRLDCTPQLFLPNAIRVNSNNPENRSFTILNEEMYPFLDEANFNVLIYNRWGEVIWQSSKIDFSWDGKRQGGSLVPMGNYPYLILYRSKLGDDKQKEHRIYGSIFVMN